MGSGEPMRYLSGMVSIGDVKRLFSKDVQEEKVRSMSLVFTGRHFSDGVTSFRRVWIFCYVLIGSNEDYVSSQIRTAMIWPYTYTINQSINIKEHLVRWHRVSEHHHEPR